MTSKEIRQETKLEEQQIKQIKKLLGDVELSIQENDKRRNVDSDNESSISGSDLDDENKSIDDKQFIRRSNSSDDSDDSDTSGDDIDK
jgi:prophage antirepressor-like protein